MSPGLTPPSLGHFLAITPHVREHSCLSPILPSQLLHPDLREQRGQIPRIQPISALEGFGVAISPI